MLSHTFTQSIYPLSKHTLPHTHTIAIRTAARTKSKSKLIKSNFNYCARACALWAWPVGYQKGDCNAMHHPPPPHFVGDSTAPRVPYIAISLDYMHFICVRLKVGYTFQSQSNFIHHTCIHTGIAAHSCVLVLCMCDQPVEAHNQIHLHFRRPTKQQ